MIVALDKVALEKVDVRFLCNSMYNRVFRRGQQWLIGLIHLKPDAVNNAVSIEFDMEIMDADTDAHQYYYAVDLADLIAACGGGPEVEKELS